MTSQPNSLDVLGKSLWAQEMRHRIPQIARHRYRIVITGPPGSGKQFLARLIHGAGNQADQPFIPVDCSYYTDETFAAQVFGAEANAIAGVSAPTMGAIRAASQGTLLLGNVNTLSIDCQQQLLETLKTRTVVPVGATQPISYDVRLMATTQVDLQKEIAERRFLAELYTHLEAISVRTVSLADRQEDIPALASFFIQMLADDLDQSPKQLSANAIKRLQSYAWSGNVSELQEAVEEAFVYCEETTLVAEDFDFLLGE